MQRSPLFLITDDDYKSLGAVDVESGRWIGRDTAGRKLFDRKDYHGAEAATKKIGRFVSSAWYGCNVAERVYADQRGHDMAWMTAEERNNV
jgi:hypothetical protein